MTDEREIERRWKAIGRICAAHVLMLRDIGLVDDDSARVLLSAVESSRDGRLPAAGSLLTLIAELDERVDAITPAGYAGAAAVGRGSIDVAGAVTRITLREDLLALGVQLDAFRTALVGMAAAHVVTLMPGYLDGQVAQPTTLGHWLGGAVGALSRATNRLHDAYLSANRSPLGSGSQASSGMPIDRERLAESLGFDGLAVNTFDAVSSADHFVDAATAVAAATGPVRRLLDEIVAWVRIEPESFLFSEEWTALVAPLPHARMPIGLQALIGDGRAIEADAISVISAAASLPYAPVAGALDSLSEAVSSAIRRCGAFLARATALLARGIVVNRALLANRAGKGFSTSSDLADFLMIEEQLDPGSARSIAALAISRARDQGLEAAGITVELIDGAALLVIGRELKVEFEAISRYLAPRRFIERRVATGAPSPGSTRAYLESEQAKLAEDAAWLAARSSRLSAALSGLSRQESDAISTAP